jgi:hypothetical protein
MIKLSVGADIVGYADIFAAARITYSREPFGYAPRISIPVSFTLHAGLRCE